MTRAGRSKDRNRSKRSEERRRKRAARSAEAAELAPPGERRPTRREPALNTLRGPLGLYYTMLPDTGGRNSWRFRIHTDFFRKTTMFCCAGDHPDDEHTRVRGSFNFGWGITDWLEAYFAVHNSANRNERLQTTRYDPETIFALGDLGFGLKGAYGFLDGGVGIGLHMGMGLLTSSEEVNAGGGVRFATDALFAVDLRQLTRQSVPLRFALNFGWLLDNSQKLLDWGKIPDPLSREVMRFGTGSDHSRLRTRLSMDFPIRLGAERNFGIDPSIEWSWNYSTFRDLDFFELVEEGSKTPRSQSYLTVGVRANIYDGLHIDAAADLGLMSPDFEWGSRVPQWQVILGMGWSITPRGRGDTSRSGPEFDGPRYGRVTGKIVDAKGKAIAGAKVRFPGSGLSTLLSDGRGQFRGYQFEAGSVTVEIKAKGYESAQATIELEAGEDHNLDIELAREADAVEGDDDDDSENDAADNDLPPGVLDGTIVDDDGVGIAAQLHVRGEAVDETFDTDDEGRIRVQLDPGQYTVEISAEGFVPETLSIRMKEAGLAIDRALERDEGASESPAARSSAEPLPELSYVSADGKRIRIRRKIRYSGSDLHDSAPAILDELAVLLEASPQYVKVEVQVHTDDRGSPRARSRARAQAVVDHLVQQGVARDRLVARGLGDASPLAVNLTPEGRRQNNRTYVIVRDYQP